MFNFLNMWFVHVYLIHESLFSEKKKPALLTVVWYGHIMFVF